MKLTKLYEKHGFTVVEKNEFILVSFKDSATVNIIVKQVDSPRELNYEEVKELYTKFFTIGTKIRCYQYRLICDKGFAPECEFFNSVNLALSGSDYLKSLKDISHIELYSHNDISYTKLCKQLETSNKSCIIQPTGTGKSLVIANFINRNASKKFIVLAPSHFIIDEIKKHLLDSESIVFHTYMKIINLSVREVKQINPDYIIVDEFHRCGADEWGIGVNMLINSFPEAKLIGTTATHIRYLDDKRNMADELFDGNIANHLTLSKALALNILPIPKYVSALYKFNDEYLRVKKSIADSLSDDKKVILERLNKIKLEFENTQSIPHILQEHLTGDIQKIIVFCKDIKHLRKHKSMVIEWFNAIGYSHINSYEVHSENDLKNKVIFNEFEHNHDKSLNIMFSVNILNEGVHIKGVNCIIMLRDTESPIIYYQQLGRCLVVGGEKPLIFDLVNNFANIRHRNLENETNAEFKRQEEIYKSKGIPYTEINFEIFDRVRNIKELLDDVEQTADSWQVFIVKLKNHINNFGNSYISNSHKDKWLVNKVRTIRANFKDGNLEKDKIEELNKLNFIWDAHIYKWELFIYKLKKYKEEFGHCNVNFDYEDQWLYTKVLNIRQQFQKGILEAEKIIELNNINFSWLSYSIDWKEFIEKLIKFKKEFGHCIIPYDFKDKKFYNTNIYIKHGFIKPTNEKVKKQLLKLGYEYNISDENVPNSSDNYWYSKYYKLKSFYEINGHCRVPRQGHILSNWVKRQRVNYKNDRLSEDKKKLLEEINFNTTTLYLNWISKFNSLKSFYEKNGTIEGISNKELRMWCSEQRKYYKSGTLEKEKIFLLESLNFIWCYYDASWEKNFSLLEIYKAEHGTTKVNKNHKLANWYFRQIRNFRDGNISEKRLLKLKSIGFEF